LTRRISVAGSWGVSIMVMRLSPVRVGRLGGHGSASDGRQRI
jgi:hypothetical protein